MVLRRGVRRTGVLVAFLGLQALRHRVVGAFLARAALQAEIVVLVAALRERARTGKGRENTGNDD